MIITNRSFSIFVLGGIFKGAYNTSFLSWRIPILKPGDNKLEPGNAGAGQASGCLPAAGNMLPPRHA